MGKYPRSKNFIILKRECSLFLGISIALVLLSFFTSQPPAAKKLHAVSNADDVGNPLLGENHTLSKLEGLLAELTDDAFLLDDENFSIYRDLGTRLDNLMRNDATPSDADWSLMEDKLIRSFPGRDIRGILHLLSCHRHFRLEAQKIQQAEASNESADHQALHGLRQKFFGRTLAYTLYAAEYQLLATLSSPATLPANDTPAESPLCSMSLNH